MEERTIQTLISTLLILITIPIIGVVVEYITKNITKVLAKATNVKTALFVMNKLTFIGTVHHELSHALYAFITGAKVTKIEPFKPNGNTLGKVELVPRGNIITKSIQLALSAIAPTTQGIIDLILLTQLFIHFDLNIWIKILLVYVMFSIFIHMTMSWADIKNAIKGLPLCSIVTFIICMIFNVNIIETVTNLVRNIFIK